MKNICLLLIFLLASLGGISAQENDSYLKSYLISYPHSVWEGARAPVTWSGSEWLIAGSVLAVGGGLYLVDEEIRDAFQNNRSELGDEVMSGFRQFGEIHFTFPALGAVILTGYLTDSDKTMDTGLLCLKSALFAGGATQALKLATQRQKPLEGQGKEFWNGSGISFDRDSFPSGHTAVVWSIAPILAHQYSESGWVAPVAYAVAALTSFSRINDDQHWASDVFCGAVVGYLAARLTLADTPRLAVYPDTALQGLAVRFEF